MNFNKSQKESIIARISFLESELNELAAFSALEWKTYLEDKPLRRNVERMIENIANATIDVAKIVLSDKNSGEIPATYVDVILKLVELKIIGLDLATRLAECVKLRNYLAHQYLDLKWDKIKSFLKSAPAEFNEFITQIKKTI
ncbi:DUF86 domain-containing protein [Candidatus Saganbacteria bacterium]|nr:DUF86 domain-containing protein [Candidatus Saganbacteria bacterium]